jgi:hypothetical protein
VLRKDDGIYRFLLSAVDLPTGTERNFTLEVPFKGQLPVPKSNYSHTTTKGGEDRWNCSGPHVLAVTQLRADKNLLRITLGMESWSATVEFDCGALLTPKSED